MAFRDILAWLKRQRHPTPISDELWQESLANLPFIAALDADTKKQLRALTEIFLSDKEFTSAGGLTLTDAMCVSIAAQGCLPILHLGIDCYRDWVGIIVYPDEFVIPRTLEDEYGIVHEYEEVAAGEAWEGGPLLISWHDAQMTSDGYNVVIHEFAHKLDMLNGMVDGTPALPPDITRKAWDGTLSAAYEHFCRTVELAASTGSDMRLDPYGAENPGEFFAVMSETFFSAPHHLREAYPLLYELFAKYYQQDPFIRLCQDSSHLSGQTRV